MHLRIIRSQFDSGLNSSQHNVMRYFAWVTAFQDVVFSFLVEQFQNFLVPTKIILVSVKQIYKFLLYLLFQVLLIKYVSLEGYDGFVPLLTVK